LLGSLSRLVVSRRPAGSAISGGQWCCAARVTEETPASGITFLIASNTRSRQRRQEGSEAEGRRDNGSSRPSRL